MLSARRIINTIYAYDCDHQGFGSQFHAQKRNIKRSPELIERMKIA